MTLDEEAGRATDMLCGKVVRRILRHRPEEVVIEFDDGSRIFADAAGPLELSIELRD